MNGTSRWFLTSIVLLGMLAMLSGCGGGSSSGGIIPLGGGGAGSDTMTFSISSNGTTTTTTYVEKKVGTAAEWGYDPYIFGYSAYGFTWLEVYDNFDPNIGWEKTLVITMPTTTGTQNVLPSSIMYDTLGSSTYYADGLQGTITFTRIDSSSGGKIEGSFDNVSLYQSGNNAVFTMSGTFKATVE